MECQYVHRSVIREKKRQNQECKNDPKMWPNVRFGDIYVYLVGEPGPFTTKTMENYRSSKPFCLVMEGHVRRVLIAPLGHRFCVLKAEVTPSQRTSNKPYDAWALVSEEGKVHAAHCTCMAGALGYFILVPKIASQCVLFFLFFKIILKVEPTRLLDLVLVKHKHGKASHPVKRKRSEPPTPRTKFPDALDALHAHVPNAAIFTAFSRYADDRDNTADPGCAEGPLESLYELYDREWEAHSREEKDGTVASLMEKTLTHANIVDIEQRTRPQRECLEWYRQRCGRITGSVFAKVAKCKSAASAARLATNIAQPPLVQYQARGRKPAPIKHGLENEPIARQAYTEYQTQQHENFQCSELGLCISKKWQFIAASPDGLVECSFCGRGVLEIKCPYKHRNAPVNDISDKTFCLDENLNLKDTHEYMYQVQAEMECADVDYCDFVCWTLQGFSVTRIKRDLDFLERHMQVLRTFVRDSLLPQLLSRKEQHLG
ncbi:hypothetical protein HPB48_013209 [Haemaphysalis longicornis]|uniref:YqaJ viral recombinase domain-containing protein n=2 Tax=Haemaphysalis longicornis TaxID=44386 RepID=A0A9J6GXK4_HAELO|nr:hypothetical protein HPB48_013209 [Haemaphysalis longicornis]